MRAPRFPRNIARYSRNFPIFVNSFDLSLKERPIQDCIIDGDKQQQENSTKMHHPVVSKMVIDRLRTCFLPVLLVDDRYRLKHNL